MNGIATSYSRLIHDELATVHLSLSRVGYNKKLKPWMLAVFGPLVRG